MHNRNFCKGGQPSVGTVRLVYDINGDFKPTNMKVTNLEEAIEQAKTFIGFSKNRKDKNKLNYWNAVMKQLLLIK